MKTVVLLLALVALAYAVPSTTELSTDTDSTDIMKELRSLDVFKLKKSAPVCPLLIGETCPESNPFFYFKCCGEGGMSCCFRLQDWAIALAVFLVVLFIISLVINLMRTIFCC